MKKLLLIPAVLALLCVCLCGCVHENKPYDPGTPEPAAHEGLFTSEHGSLRFSGDGKTVTIDFDGELAGLTGLPAGETAGSYAFLSGDLPPHGSVPVRYDTAYELKLTAGETSVTVGLGEPSQDGKSRVASLGMVTPEKIPLAFRGDGETIFVVFEKQPAK